MDCGDNVGMDGQISIFDIAVSCENCKKFKIDCPQEAPTLGLCNKYKALPDWVRVERCQNCSRWVYTGDQAKPISWGVFGACLEHDQKTDACGYCMNFESVNAKKK